ncbi:hypothetical protein NMG60_11001115 [Bertholletia excelsa]
MDGHTPFTAFTSHPKFFSLLLNACFLCLLVFFLSSFSTTSSAATVATPPKASLRSTGQDTCTGLHDLSDYESKCHYVMSETSCYPEGFLNYLQLFYCTCAQLPVFGYSFLILWLILLFYLFGNTTANYFCPSLESLSGILKLSPIIAGTTLLPLGNGATDVFASIISFTRSGDGGVGINCVLGGAFFISSVVSGLISILITNRGICIEKDSFVRDVLFFLFALCCLLFIIIAGKISLWGALGFVSIYFCYISVVFGMHFFFGKKERVVSLSLISSPSSSFLGQCDEMDTPLLGCVDEEKPILVESWDCKAFDQKDGFGFLNLDPSVSECLGWVMYILQLPLYLPRRLTIPVAREEDWSKPFAVTSVTLAPILLATLWNTQHESKTAKTSLAIYVTAGLIGFLLGCIALLTTKKSSPPKSCLLPWLGAEFLMSITWTYMIAQELISLLASLGHVLAISPSILGFTVLAWGNSTGDLIANSAMAMKGGPDGAQMAISGCYAGPLFNTLVGLGISLVFAAWSEFPSSYEIPLDPYLYELIGFFMAALLWALVIMVKKNMKLDWTLGGGLLAIYSCFLFLRFSRTL